MAEETQYTANTGMATISTANSNLDGSGTLGTILTGASNGTLIKSVSIKATGNTTVGMVRLFVHDGANTAYLLLEVPVPKNAQASTNPAWEEQITLDFTLKSGYILKASTQVAESFNVIAEGMDWAYYGGSVRTDTTKWTPNNGRASISTANSNLDGSGTLGTAFTAGTSATYKGASIRSISIKSTVNVTSGMVRIFLYDGTNTALLLTEIPVKTETKSALDEAFDRTVIFDDDFDLKAGWSIKVSTQVAENFRVVVEGTDWSYVA